MTRKLINDMTEEELRTECLSLRMTCDVLSDENKRLKAKNNSQEPEQERDDKTIDWVDYECD